MRPHKSDHILLIVIVLLALMGLVMLTSASSVAAQEKFGSPYYFISHQITFGLIPGLILFLTAIFIPYQFWKKIAPFLFLVILALLVLVFLPQFGYGAGGAKRWLSLWGISFQPSEISKIALIFYMASWLANREKEIKHFKNLFFLLLGPAILGFLIFLQPDIGTLGVIGLISLTMLFLGGVNLPYMFMLAGLGLAGSWYIINLAPYRIARLKAFFNPHIDPIGISYQISQALIAIGSGGIFGLGLGQSRQKFIFLPEPISDSIFAIFAEEAGFVGASIVILLFLLFVWRGIKIAKNSPDRFARFLSLGIVSLIGIQAFVHMAAISGLMPLTGITLPFMSYGGTSLAVTMFASGILLNISKHTV